MFSQLPQGILGESAAQVLMELIRDNLLIIDRITPPMIKNFVKQLKKRKVCKLPETEKLAFCFYYIDCFVQDCSNSIANALELLQSCVKSSR